MLNLHKYSKIGILGENMRLKQSLLLLILVLFSACATPSADPKINMKPPEYVEELPPKRPRANISNAGSLYGRGDNPLFSDRKAMNVNDIVTVVISETIAQSSQASKSINDENQDSLGAGLITNEGKAPVVSTLAKTLNKFGNIGFKTNSSSSFSGGGSNTRNENFTTTISARIIKVLNNGNYFISGGRELLINGEKQIVQISGVIRPYDISQANQIDSKYIADAKILYKTQGEIERSTKKPWGSKLIKSIWPF